MVGMRVIHRMLAISLLLPAPVGLVEQAQAAVDQETPVRGGKTVKECNEELARNTAALEAAGESASTFFHTCWLHGEKDKPTPIVADGKGAASPGGQPAPKREAEVDTGERRAVRHATRHATSRLYRGRRTARARPERGDDGVAGVDDATAVPAAIQYQAVRSPSSQSPSSQPPSSRSRADRPPGHLDVGVPLVGVVAVPILPGLETTVQGVVEHPLVPGLVSTSP